VSGYEGRTLPEIVLVGLDRTESKIGTIMMWVSLPFVVIFVAAFFMSDEPMAEKVPALYLAGMFGVFTAAFFFMSRKRHRVHRSSFAQTLLHRPETIRAVRAELRVPQPGGVRHVAVPMNGQVEFEPLPDQTTRVLFFSVVPRMWVHVKLEGKLLARKLVVPQHRGAELLSWLFATAAEANPSCGWGETKISDI
jgi:hypothetical protein